MRILTLFLLVAVPVTWAGETGQSKYPLWDGHESVADYARRANLSPTKMLDLGNDVKLEMVLIPAGEFIMGTPKPVPVEEAEFNIQIVSGQYICLASGGVLLILVGAIVVKAFYNRQLPKYSLLYLLGVTITTGGCILGGLHWRQSRLDLERAKANYVAEWRRYNADYDTELPSHRVTLTSPFYLGKYTVTQAQYEQVMGANPSHFNGKDNPVENVSWFDAQEFCARLSGTNQLIRLPTDAEWEFACRAGTVTLFYAGDTNEDLARVGWYGEISKGTTHPVGQKTPNWFGLYDMHGNVGQWCQDWFGPLKPDPAVDPKGPQEGTRRVLRGGYWNHDARFCRSAWRGDLQPGVRDFLSSGFRAAMRAP